MEIKKKKERMTRARKLIAKLKQMFPSAGMTLRHRTNWELLVAVILSAQCTDKRVNMVTKKLFRKYKKFDDYLLANPSEFEKDIHSTGFYKNKTKNILVAAKVIHKKFKRKIPKTMEEILSIPGVGRKTASVVLGNAYGIVEGIAVDTHVRRLAIKFDLTDKRDPKHIERDLMEIIPRHEWFRFTYLAIEYGREICPGRRHECKSHPLSKIYLLAASRFPRAK
ncbi:MAG: endonuclease III [Nanoarchaeota archaeon]|nr:endonuclease III [Nanoarchaeota archaeon]